MKASTQNDNSILQDYITNSLECQQDSLLNTIEDDIIAILNTGDNASMEQYKLIELLTVISLTDNPTLNLKVAQPAKYMITKHTMGDGILAYKFNAKDTLLNTIAQHEKVIKIQVKIYNSRVLDICSDKYKQYLREVYKTANKEFESDNEFMNYAYKKSNKKYDSMLGIVALGKRLFKNSSIPEYIDRGFLLKNSDIIYRAEEL